MPVTNLETFCPHNLCPFMRYCSKRVYQNFFVYGWDDPLYFIKTVLECKNSLGCICSYHVGHLNVVCLGPCTWRTVANWVHIADHYEMLSRIPAEGKEYGILYIPPRCSSCHLQGQDRLYQCICVEYRPFFCVSCFPSLKSKHSPLHYHYCELSQVSMWLCIIATWLVLQRGCCLSFQMTQSFYNTTKWTQDFFSLFCFFLLLQWKWTAAYKANHIQWHTIFIEREVLKHLQDNLFQTGNVNKTS